MVKPNLFAHSSLEFVNSPAQGPLADLPTPILQNILCFFDKPEYFVLAFVCKRWKSLVVRNQSTDFFTLVFYYSRIGSLPVLKWLRLQTSLK